MTFRTRTGVVALMLATVASCGDDQAPGPGDATAALTPPEPPVFTPCPDGWTEVAPSSEDGVTTCSPWPDGASQSCAADEAHFTGEPGCSRIGTACPDGDWAENLPSEGSVLYVRAGASAGGAGTRESPFASIAEATAAAVSGTIIAVGKGTFEENIELPEGVTLWGACVAETVVAAPVPSATDAAVTVGSVDSDVRNLQLTGPAPGILVEAGGSLHVEDVLIEGAEQSGIQVSEGAALSARSLVVRNTEATLDEDSIGQGLALASGEADVSRVVFELNSGVSVLVAVGGRLSMEQVVVRETLPAEGNEGTPFAVGLLTFDSDVEVAAALFECNAFTSVSMSGAGGAASLSDVVVRGSLEADACEAGHGLLLTDGAQVVANRTLFDRNMGAAIWVDDGTQLTLSDGIVRNTGVTHGEFGMGLYVEGGRAALDRVIFEDNTGLSIGVWRTDGELDAEDVVVKETAQLACADPCDRPTYGIGVQSVGGAAVRMTRFEVLGNDLCGLQLAEAGEMDLLDGLVRDHPVGVNVQTDPFDLDRLTNRVVYLDNERNLDSSSLPVPNPAVLLAQ